MRPYYEHAGITIYHGDCRDVLPQVGRHDLLLTDPPYGLKEAAGKNASRSKQYGGKRNGLSHEGRVVFAKDYGHSDWDNEPPTAQDVELVRSLARWQIIFGGNYFQLPPARCWLVWDKVNSGDFADCELAWTNLDRAVRQFTYMWNGMLREFPRGTLPSNSEAPCADAVVHFSRTQERRDGD